MTSSLELDTGTKLPPEVASDAVGSATPRAEAAVGGWKRWSRRWMVKHLLACAVILTSVGFMLGSAHRLSPVADEGLHMMRGLAFWSAKDTRLSYAHPPVSNLLYAAPGALLYERYPVEKKLRTWDEGVNSSREYARNDYPAMRARVISGRTTGIVLAALAFGYFYLFCLQFFGWGAAISSLTLLALNPTVMAHASLFTTDFPVMAALFISLGEAIRWLFAGSRWGAARFGFAAGAALATKYSAVPVVALLTLLALVLPLVPIVTGVFRKRTTDAGFRRPRLGRRLAELLGAGLLMLAVINASYRFQKTGWTVEQILNEREVSSRRVPSQQMLEHTPIGKLPKWLRLPLPYTYVMGLGFVYTHAEGGHGSWFMGRASRTGHSYYFPVLFLLKTPIPVLALLAAGIPLALARRRRVKPALLVMIILPLVLMASLTGTRINIGFRHALPVVAMLTVVAGVVAAELVELTLRLRERARAWGSVLTVVPVGLVASTVVPVTTNYPEYVGYFNAVVGREGGHNISIVAEDWGQDAAFLAQLAKEKKLAPLYYAPYAMGSYEFKHFGVSYLPLPCQRLPAGPGWIAVHRVSDRRRPSCLKRVLAKSKLEYRINEHIYVYRYPGRRPKERKPGSLRRGT